jgi:hypothetical protein
VLQRNFLHENGLFAQGRIRTCALEELGKMGQHMQDKVQHALEKVIRELEVHRPGTHVDG